MNSDKGKCDKKMAALMKKTMNKFHAELYTPEIDKLYLH